MIGAHIAIICLLLWILICNVNIHRNGLIRPVLARLKVKGAPLHLTKHTRSAPRGDAPAVLGLRHTACGGVGYAWTLYETARQT